MKKIILSFVLGLMLVSCGQTTSKSDPNDHQTNPDHLSKLMEGVDAWNEWRLQNPHEIPDLENADLTQANLEGYDLQKAVLSNANMAGANLKKSDLSKANLRGADLSTADLSGAILIGTRYDGRTKWPEGFDPVAAGATQVAP